VTADAALCYEDAAGRDQAARTESSASLALFGSRWARLAILRGYDPCTAVDCRGGRTTDDGGGGALAASPAKANCQRGTIMEWTWGGRAAIRREEG